ncbi:3H domain-containing protein [Caproiciproducens sp. LBM24188]|nr:transcription repressor NadR [Oscillospiraceae bacterium]HHV31250.1 transcription repressor NadR [Clostridiales bacterium]
MDAAQRRQQILELLKQSTTPVSAGKLAAEFHVSRQIIVGDIALLRAANEEISATPRGYIMNRSTPTEGMIHTIACRHSRENLGEELYTIVDSGCGVIDVIVEHPVYGQLSGQLQIYSRFDVDNFLDRLSKNHAAPLSNLTDGIHLHTVLCRSEQAYEIMLDQLRKKNILFQK